MCDKYTPQIGEACELLYNSKPHSRWHKITVLYIDSDVTVYRVEGYTASFNCSTSVVAFRKVQTEEGRFIEHADVVWKEWRSHHQLGIVDFHQFLYRRGFRYVGVDK